MSNDRNRLLLGRIYHRCKNAASSFSTAYGGYPFYVGALLAWGVLVRHYVGPDLKFWQLGLAGILGSIIGQTWHRATHKHHGRKGADDNKITSWSRRSNSQPTTSNENNSINDDDNTRRDFKLIYGHSSNPPFDYTKDK